VRTFIAVFPPEEVVAALAGAVDRARERGDGVSWVRQGNLHYTLRFLGELEQKQVDGVCRAVASVAREAEPIRMSLGGPGAFPNFRRPRVLWIGAEEGAKDLEILARAVNEALSREGFGRPDKPFRAHLTVGRVRDARRAATAAGRFSQEKVEGNFQVRKIVVVHSTLDPGGSIYRPLLEAELGAAGGQTTS
jgi:2'-5' RNA ligase